MIARNGSALVGEFITHIDTIPTAAMNHSERHRALLGPEYTSGVRRFPEIAIGGGAL